MNSESKLRSNWHVRNYQYWQRFNLEPIIAAAWGNELLRQSTDLQKPVVLVPLFDKLAGSDKAIPCSVAIIGVCEQTLADAIRELARLRTLPNAICIAWAAGLDPRLKPSLAEAGSHFIASELTEIHGIVRATLLKARTFPFEPLEALHPIQQLAAGWNQSLPIKNLS